MNNVTEFKVGAIMTKCEICTDKVIGVHRFCPDCANEIVNFVETFDPVVIDDAVNNIKLLNLIRIDKSVCPKEVERILSEF